MKLRNWNRWFWSKACVTDGERISETFVIDAASGVVTSKLEPQLAPPGAEPIVGRVPLNRYGGE